MSWIYWSLLSALFAAATAILAKLGVANINSNLATAVRTSVVFFLAWGIALAEVPISAIAGISRRTFVFLVLSGLATGLSWVCYFRSDISGREDNIRDRCRGLADCRGRRDSCIELNLPSFSIAGDLTGATT